MNRLLLVVLLAAAALPASAQDKGKRWVTMDSVVLRDAPDAKGKKLDELVLGDPVDLTGEQGSKPATVKLRCKDVTASWLKVKTAQGKDGWVFGGALGADRVDPGPQKWRAVISFWNPSEEYPSEDSMFFDQDISEACSKGKNPFVFAWAKQPCAVIGDEKAPLSVIDTSAALKGVRNGDRWMLVERNGREKTVKVLGYNPDSRDQAVKFCSGE